ncbi:hypothetical protein ACTHGU_08390 [Chitinophagaceae bacterium MMS25-I14]
MNKTNIRHWQSLHNDWLRALDFYKGEIGILRSRLNEIAGKNTGKEMLSDVEHYESQFTLHTDNIEQLQHDINQNIAAIGSGAEKNNGFVDNSLLEKLEQQHGKYMDEEQSVNELRHSFNIFSSEWM